MADIEARQPGIPARRSRTTGAASAGTPDVADDDRYYQDRHMGSSARRYQPPRTTTQRDTDSRHLVPGGPAIQRVDAYGRPVIRQGNREYVMVPAHQAKRRFHWSLLLGLAMLLMLAGWVALSALGTWWTDWRDYTDYGYPRTDQVDAVVGHGDSQAHPSHFIFLNLGGQVVVVEFPGGDVTKAVDYRGAVLVGPHAADVPVTGRFADMNGDGKPDMEIDYGGEHQVWLNTGQKFVQPGS